ncbi:hypothetical protein LINPERPRIM_LOCUS6104, partial [Linum perenne]
TLPNPINSALPLQFNIGIRKGFHENLETEFLTQFLHQIFQRKCIVESCGLHRVVAFVVHWGLNYRYSNKVYTGTNNLKECNFCFRVSSDVCGINFFNPSLRWNRDIKSFSFRCSWLVLGWRNS